MASVPNELSPIKMYLVRAAEVKDRNPIVSYWCKFYAIQVGLGIKADSGRTFLKNLVNELELAKKEFKDEDGVTNQTVGQAIVENFAVDLFNKADSEDRAGQASSSTGKTFVAACHFFEVLNVFGADSVTPEIMSKIRYSKWRAAQILKAAKEGTPIPPPPAAEDGDSPVEEALDTVEAPKVSEPVPTAPVKVIPASQPVVNVVPIAQSSHNPNPNTLLYDPAVIQAAQKKARFCISALQYDDVQTAIANLEQALELLGPYRNH